MLVAAAVLGLLIGVVIGGLGGGGGVLTVPVLVYLLGQGAHDATTSSVLIVGVSSVVGFLARVRSPGLSWRTGLAFAAVGIPASYLGGLLNQRVSAPVLLLVFAAVVLVAAAAMLLNDPVADDDRNRPPVEPATGGAVAVTTRPTTARRARLAGVAKILLCGSISGLLTGLLGVGGGFLVVPALVVVLRMPITLAIGTSLLIIVLNSGAALAARIGELHLDWAVVGPFTIAAIIGTLLGKKVADACSGAVLTRAFAVMLVLVGGFVAVQSAGALLG
jgi:uncharacterized membrane protein YfcA